MNVMKYLYLIPLFSIAFISNPAVAEDGAFDDDKRGTNAPIIMMPKLSDDARKDMDVNIFSGIGRIFKPKEQPKAQANIGNSAVKTGKLNSKEAFVQRYSGERQKRLEAAQADTWTPKSRADNPYNATLMKSYNPYTHYQDPNTGQVRKLPQELDPEVVAKVQDTVTAYAKEKGVRVDELMEDPKFVKKLERHYAETLKKHKKEKAQKVREEAAKAAKDGSGT